MHTAAKCEWNFSIYNHESISEEKIFTRFLIKIFSSEIHFTNQRSNLYWKWRKWLMWGEHERRNEWKFKNIRMKKIEKNQNNKADYKKKTRKLWKWIVIGGNFFIISRIINWVTSQFLNINFKSGSRTPALSKVEFIVTGAAITMFLVQLVFLLSLINIGHYHWNVLENLWKVTVKKNCVSVWAFTPIANNIIVSAFSMFSNMI